MTRISTSPLCPHIEQGSGLDWLASLSVRPKAVKTFSSGACRDVKSIDPAIITIKRRWVQDQEAYLREGARGGRRFVDEQGDLGGVDILEGLNEYVPGGDIEAQYRAKAWTWGFIDACAERGVKPCIFNLAVGNPEPEEIDRFASLITYCLDRDGYVGYHGYGPSFILYDQEWLAFRDVLTFTPRLESLGVRCVRWIHTEAGYDRCNTPIPSGAWRDLVNRGVMSVGEVQQGYSRYAQRCRDFGVEIACIYTFWGTEQWRLYEHADSPEMLSWFAGHWEEWSSPPPQPPPQATRARVVGTGGAGLRVRAGAGTNQPILGVLPEDGVWLSPVERVNDSWARLPLTEVEAAGVWLRPSSSGPAWGYVMSNYLEWG